ncbi:Embryonic polyadenylate-binding protein 2 [Linum grandiflorum]
MGSVDRVEDRTFRVNFTEDGVGRLRERVMDKLTEFMGDYTDDTLVDYVIVLLRNGRNKEEAKNELDVFLGEDTDPFVSWLWDHLASSIDLYASHSDIDMNKKGPRSSLGAELVGDESHEVDFESKKLGPENTSKSRHRREWRDIKRESNEHHSLRSSVVFDDDHADDKTRHKGNHERRSQSPRGSHKKKRSRHDEQQESKVQRDRETASQATIDVPRRLLQFAVREAVGTSKTSSSAKEPSLKRLRSVVAASTEEAPLVDHPRRIQSIAKIPSGMATVIKAVQQAADDVTKVKPSRSVFDRLGRDSLAFENNEQLAEYRDVTVEEEKYTPNKYRQMADMNLFQRNAYMGQVGHMSMGGNNLGLVSDFMPNGGGFDDDMGIDHRDVAVMQSGTSHRSKDVHSSIVHQNVASHADGIISSKPSDTFVPAANTSRMVTNSSSNLNSWRSARIEQTAPENEKPLGKVGVQIMKENNNPVVTRNGTAKPATYNEEAERTLSTPPGSLTAGRPTEDADSRTIFVSNVINLISIPLFPACAVLTCGDNNNNYICWLQVHFAATKDSLSRHFNKFGEVLKVVILTDAATRQPKGSAYVEFLRKDAAESALTLNGTSFMSRILKVIKKSAAPPQEDTPATTARPRAAPRGSPYAVARFSRSPFGRGAFRPRGLVKLGSRSMQWKRDAQGEAGSPGSAGSARSSFVPRGLTYVRTEPKPEATSSSATATTTH